MPIAGIYNSRRQPLLQYARTLGLHYAAERFASFLEARKLLSELEKSYAAQSSFTAGLSEKGWKDWLLKSNYSLG